MFVGHLAPAIAVASRKEAPSLALLCIGGQLVDIGFFLFVLSGIEHMRLVPGITKMMPLDLYDMPYTHSLLGTALFALGFGVAVAASISQPHRWRAGVLAALVVLSHWFLDVLVHRPDMTVFGRDKAFGLGLWNHPAVEMVLELGLLVAAVWLYDRRTRPLRPRSGLATRQAHWLFLGLMIGMQMINWFGPPPTTVLQTALLALLAFGSAALAAWFVQSTRRPV